MAVRAIEGVVENGVIRLPKEIVLPEKTTVLVVVEEHVQSPLKIMSPRLVNPADAKDFEKVVTEVEADGGV